MLRLVSIAPNTTLLPPSSIGILGPARRWSIDVTRAQAGLVSWGAAEVEGDAVMHSRRTRVARTAGRPHNAPPRGLYIAGAHAGRA